MTDINYSQYRMLCKINKVTKINPNDFSKEDFFVLANSWQKKKSIFAIQMDK